MQYSNLSSLFPAPEQTRGGFCCAATFSCVRKTFQRKFVTVCSHTSKAKENSEKKISQKNFFSLAEDLIWKRDTGKREQEEEDGSNQATQSCSHGFSLRWQKLLGNPVCSGVNTSSDDKSPLKLPFLFHTTMFFHIYVPRFVLRTTSVLI